MNLFLILASLVALGIAGALAVRAIGGNFRLVEDWKKAFKWYSTWAAGFIFLIPTMVNQAAAEGLFDFEGMGTWEGWLVRGSAAALFLTRIVSQHQKPELPDFGEPGPDA